MSKGNLFLGFARGAVGDVVMYRAYGEQIARARNRHPANPNSVRQQVQRAVSASVQRLYSAGMAVFNHAFEGKAVGAESQREFVKRNMSILRSLVVSDINAGRVDKACNGRVSAPGLPVAVPFDGMMISAGRLSQLAFEWDVSEGQFALVPPLRDSQSEQFTETVAAYAARVGLVAGDIYTFVVMGCDPLEGAELGYYGGEPYSKYAAVYPLVFNYAQLRVREDVSTNTDLLLSTTTYGTFFEASTVGVDLTSIVFNLPIAAQTVDERAVSACFGCIRSREDSGQRSNSFMHVVRSAYDWGIASNWLTAAWDASARLAGSDLILEGRDFITSSGLVITPSFEFPITAQALSRKTLSFSEAVTMEQILASLVFTDSDSNHFNIVGSGSQFFLSDGTDNLNSVELSADGLTLTFGVMTAEGPTFTGFVWS